MNFIKRALFSSTRRKGKTAILFLVVFMLGNVMAFGVAVKQATTNIDKNIKQNLGGVVSAEMDGAALDKEYSNGNTDIYQNLKYIPISTIESIGQSQYLKYYDYTISSGYIAGDKLQTYKSEDDGGVVVGDFFDYVYAKGINYTPVMDIEEGLINLVDGKSISESDVTTGNYVAMIPKEFAELNNLNIGDSFVLKNSVIDYNTGQEAASTEVVLEVIGIFEQVAKNDNNTSGNNSEDDWIKNYEKEMANNTIYVPNQVIINENNNYLNMLQEADSTRYEEEKSDYETPYTTPLFVLNSVEDLDKFLEEAEPQLPEYYIMKYASDSYNDISGSIDQMSSMSSMILVASIVATFAILSLVVVLFLRDRKHEFGIYLALGETKIKLLLQIMIEVMSVAFIAITISLFSGNMIAKSLSNNMLQSELTKATENNNGYITINTGLDAGSYMNEISTEDVINAYQIDLTADFITMIYLVGLGTSLISTAIPMIYTLRLKPKKILM